MVHAEGWSLPVVGTTTNMAEKFERTDNRILTPAQLSRWAERLRFRIRIIRNEMMYEMKHKVRQPQTENEPLSVMTNRSASQSTQLGVPSQRSPNQMAHDGMLERREVQLCSGGEVDRGGEVARNFLPVMKSRNSQGFLMHNQSSGSAKLLATGSTGSTESVEPPSFHRYNALVDSLMLYTIDRETGPRFLVKVVEFDPNSSTFTVRKVGFNAILGSRFTGVTRRRLIDVHYDD